jgi:hypothetical protein
MYNKVFPKRKFIYLNSFHFSARAFPENLFGFWVLNDDQFFLGNTNNFNNTNISGKIICVAPINHENLFNLF